MTDVKELMASLRTLSKAHTMNGEARTADALSQAASALQSLVERNEKLEEALKLYSLTTPPTSLT